jgi:hypothetical protein
MTFALVAALLFSGSSDTWLSFALGVAVGLGLVLLSKRLRRKEDR